MKNSKGKMLIVSFLAIILAFLCVFGLKAKEAKAGWHAPSDSEVSMGSYMSKSDFTRVTSGGDTYGKWTTNLTFYETTGWMTVTVGGNSSSHGFEVGKLYVNGTAGSASSQYLSTCSGDKSTYKTMYIRFKFNYLTSC